MFVTDDLLVPMQGMEVFAEMAQRDRRRAAEMAGMTERLRADIARLDRPLGGLADDGPDDEDEWDDED